MAKAEMPKAEETVEVEVEESTDIPEKTTIDEVEVEVEKTDDSEKVEVEVSEEDKKELAKLTKVVTEQQRIQKVNDRFIQGAKDFGNSVVEDTIIPGVKNIAMEIVQRIAGSIVEAVGNALGLDIKVNGLNRAVKTGLQKNRRLVKTYTNYATTIPERSTLTYGGRERVRPKEPRNMGFSSKQVAEDILETSIQECVEYGSLTLSSFYEIVDNFVEDEIGDWSDWSFTTLGWFPQDLEKVGITWLSNGWYLDLPTPHRLA